LARIHHEHFGDVGRAAGRELVARSGDRRGNVVELAVGSGVSSRVLLDAGFEVLGVDASPPMLELARAHAPAGRYVEGSLWDFAIPPALAVTAAGEAFNYVAGVDDAPDTDRLRGRFEDIHRALEAGGLFLFDMTTSFDGEEDETRGVRFEAEDVFMVMEESQVGDRLVRVIDSFVPEGALYRRIHEVHRLVLFDADHIERLLAEVGFRDVARLEGYDDEPFRDGWFGFVAYR
jgi:SAM-dependent methyltransferase